MHQDLTTLINDDSSSEWSDYPVNIRQQGVFFQGQIIGMPGAGISLLMYVRRDLFQVRASERKWESEKLNKKACFIFPLCFFIGPY